MSELTPVLPPAPVGASQAMGGGPKREGVGGKVYRRISGIRGPVLWFIVVAWSLPTFGLLASSFRSRDEQGDSGWWNIFGGIDKLTLDNYRTVLKSEGTASLWDSLFNSIAIAVPATLIPIAIAAFAAYAFAWIDFKGRKWMFIATVSLLAIPLQVALIPLLQLFVGGAHVTVPVLHKTITLFPDLDLAGKTTAVWLTHTGFALPFAIFLIHNYISGLPKDLFEAARIDGADHFTVFWRLVLPLSVPVLAAFGIFQFLWTWNDYLIANTLVGSNPDAVPTTIRIANLAGDFGLNEFLLPAGAFVQAFVPLVVFFALQRYFVRGLLAGSVKG
jgi:alpha-glucoside transport system permease protein